MAESNRASESFMKLLFAGLRQMMAFRAAPRKQAG